MRWLNEVSYFSSALPLLSSIQLGIKEVSYLPPLFRIPGLGMNEQCYSDEFPSDTGVLIKLKEFLWLALALLHIMLPVI